MTTVTRYWPIPFDCYVAGAAHIGAPNIGAREVRTRAAGHAVMRKRRPRPRQIDGAVCPTAATEYSRLGTAVVRYGAVIAHGLARSAESVRRSKNRGRVLSASYGRGGRLLFDEDHQGLGHDAVMSHRLGRFLTLHGSHKGIKVGDVHEHGDLGWVLRIDKGSDVGDTERTKDLPTLR